ncbi:MAG: hypothetical protein HYV09_26575 [Deltaproteobacteria bacterium]|nr:hypothetical protein [Deltaproteobacteria bacterium]
MTLASKSGPATDCVRHRGLGRRTHELRDAIVRVLDGFDGSMSTRQVFYQVVSIGAIENSPANYDRVQRAIVAMRRDGTIPYARIVDRTRRKYQRAAWDSAEEAVGALHSQYRRDLWADQPTVVHVACEKQALEGIFAAACDEYGASLWILRGFISEGFVWEWAEDIRALNAAGKRVVIAFFGDFDPSGLDLERDLLDRLDGFGAEFECFRWGIHREDIDEYGIPSVGVKATDSRTKRFVAEHGTVTAELDALPPAVLRKRVKDAIVDEIDPTAWNRLVEITNIERESMAHVARNWNSIVAMARPGGEP